MTKRKKIYNAVGIVFGISLIIVCLVPFCYVLSRSFVTANGVDFQPYYDVFWGHSQYLVRFWRSLGMSLCICAGQLIVSVFAGFAFAKYSFRGRNALFFLLMILMVLPIQVTLIPNYIMLGQLNLLDRYASLILPSIFAPLGTFILRQSFASVHDSVLDAAQLDGCGALGTLFRIMLPMNLSGLVCVLLLSFLDAWNMVEQPIVYLKSFASYPLSVALAYTPPADATLQLVCCIFVTIPPLFLFVLFNQELIEGITLAEVK